MADCDVKTEIDAILQAFSDLCDRCCSSSTDCMDLLPGNTADMCGDGSGLLKEIHDAVVSFLDGTTPNCEGPVCEDDYSPDPGFPPQGGCLTEEWLSEVLSWITGMGCGYDCYGNYFHACANQCACAGAETIVLRTNLGPVVLIERHGVQCWYIKGDQTDAPLTPDVIISDTNVCPSPDICDCPDEDMSPYHLALYYDVMFTGLPSPLSCLNGLLLLVEYNPNSGYSCGYSLSGYVYECPGDPGAQYEVIAYRIYVSPWRWTITLIRHPPFVPSNTCSFVFQIDGDEYKCRLTGVEIPYNSQYGYCPAVTPPNPIMEWFDHVS